MDFAQFRHEVRTWLAANPPARAERIPHDEASLRSEEHTSELQSR